MGKKTDKQRTSFLKVDNPSDHIQAHGMVYMYFCHLLTRLKKTYMTSHFIYIYQKTILSEHCMQGDMYCKCLFCIKI